MQRKLYATLCASAILAAGVTAASASSEHRRHHDGRHALRGVALTADQKLLSYPILIVTAERGDGDPRPSRNVVLRSGG